MINYPLNKKIVVFYKSNSGIEDLVLFITNPENITTQISFSENSFGLYKAEFIPSTIGIWSTLVVSEGNKESVGDFYNITDNYTIDNKLKVQDAIYTTSREWQSIGANYKVIPPIFPDAFKQNIFDFRIDEAYSGVDGQIELIGGRYYIKDNSAINENDFLEFSVVDKDNILGLFEIYGLVVGTDILELKKFIKTHSVIGGQIVEFNPGQVKILYAGLYLRLSYTSYGNTQFAFKIDYIMPA